MCIFQMSNCILLEPQSGPYVTVFPQARLASEIANSPTPEPPRSHDLGVVISTPSEILLIHLLVVSPSSSSFK